MLFKSYEDVVVSTLSQRNSLRSLGLNFSCDRLFDYVKNEFNSGTDAISLVFVIPNDRIEPVVVKVVSYYKYGAKYYDEFYSLISGE